MLSWSYIDEPFKQPCTEKTDRKYINCNRNELCSCIDACSPAGICEVSDKCPEECILRSSAIKSARMRRYMHSAGLCDKRLRHCINGHKNTFRTYRCFKEEGGNRVFPANVMNGGKECLQSAVDVPSEVAAAGVDDRPGGLATGDGSSGKTKNDPGRGTSGGGGSSSIISTSAAKDEDELADADEDEEDDGDQGGGTAIKLEQALESAKATVAENAPEFKDSDVGVRTIPRVHLPFTIAPKTQSTLTWADRAKALNSVLGSIASGDDGGNTVRVHLLSTCIPSIGAVADASNNNLVVASGQVRLDQKVNVKDVFPTLTDKELATVMSVLVNPVGNSGRFAISVTSGKKGTYDFATSFYKERNGNWWFPVMRGCPLQDYLIHLDSTSSFTITRHVATAQKR